MIDSNQYLQIQNENETGKVRCEMRTDTAGTFEPVMRAGGLAP
jgi:hypothetical protein